VFEGRSALSGRVRVVEDRRERRMLVAGDTLSVYPLNGDWSRLRREYWWRAVEAVPIPPRPAVLLVGLGGGTQVHLLHQLARPRRITAIERDPVILHAAQEWFGLRNIPALEYLCGDAAVVTAWLATARRRFDYIMEDAAYAAAPALSEPLARALVPLVAPEGVLVLNRHRRGDAGRLATLLRPSFRRVWLRRVRREAENVLLCCAGPLGYAAGRRL
jgi:protein-L-isoaspartate O-methyltransferase